MAKKIDSPAVVEEIIVTAKKQPGRSFSDFFTRGFGEFSPARRSASRPRTAAIGSKERPAIQSAAKTLKELELLKSKQQKIIDEIIVKAKRIPKPPIGFVRAFAGPALFAADVGARIVDQISRQRLDEIGRIATLTDPAKPDTPVATIQPEVIPEIVVTAKRPAPTRPPSRLLLPADSGFIGDPRVRLGAGRPRLVSTVSVPKPTLPTKKKPLISSLPAFPGEPLTLVPPQSTSRPAVTTRPQTIPRSRLLGIGSGGTPTVIPGLTGVGAGGVPLPQTSPVRVASGFCPPCPKAKKKKETKRRKCYKKLVEERRNKSSDKEFRWTRIDCDTGRELTGKK